MPDPRWCRRGLGLWQIAGDQVTATAWERADGTGGSQVARSPGAPGRIVCRTHPDLIAWYEAADLATAKAMAERRLWLEEQGQGVLPEVCDG